MFNHAALALSTVASSRISDSWVWYVIRAAGISSLTLLVLLMASGIGHVTGWTYRFVAPIKAWALHKAMAIALGISLILHIGGLLLDHYVRFNILDILVPFHKLYSNGSTLFGLQLTWIAVPAGIIAAYGVYLVLFSSLDSVNWKTNHKKPWKLTHILSYVSMLLIVFHVLGSGTDFKETSWRLLMTATGVALFLGMIARLARSKFAAKPDNQS